MTAQQSAIRVSKLGYVGFATPDLDRLIEYYTKALCFDLVDGAADRAFLTTGIDHHCVVVNRGDTRGRHVVGYEVWEDLDTRQKRLKDAGYESPRRSDIAPSTPDVLVLDEPGTGIPLHLSTAQGPSGVGGTRPCAPPSSATSPRSARAWTRSRASTRTCWASGGPTPSATSSCSCAATPTTTRRTSWRARSSPGMHHIAYEMRDLNHLMTTLDHLAKHDYRLHWGPGRHGPGHNLFTYHRDPDGNVIELFTQLDVMHDEAKGYFEPRPWHEDFPRYPKTWEVDIATVNQWGAGGSLPLPSTTEDVTMRLEGKRVLITGTAGGQGEAAQAMFAREGARVIGCDVQDGAAEKTAAALRAEGYDVTGSHGRPRRPEAAAAAGSTRRRSGSAASTCSTTTRPVPGSRRSPR